MDETKLLGFLPEVCTGAHNRRAVVAAQRFRLVSCAASGRGGRAIFGRGRDEDAGRVGSESFGSLRDSEITSRATRGLPTFGERIAPS